MATLHSAANTARICVYVNGPTFLGATFHRNSNKQERFKLQLLAFGNDIYRMLLRLSLESSCSCTAGLEGVTKP